APAGQPAAWAELRRFRGRGAAARFLLRGVTGSGKTEVYLQAIARCLEPGREAIVLVPEISLTPQMVDRFKGRFGDRVADLHSRLSQGARYDEWRKIHRGQVSVAVGARSAVLDRKSTRLNSRNVKISYAVVCLTIKYTYS